MLDEIAGRELFEGATVSAGVGLQEATFIVGKNPNEFLLGGNRAFRQIEQPFLCDAASRTRNVLLQLADSSTEAWTVIDRSTIPECCGGCTGALIGCLIHGVASVSPDPFEADVTTLEFLVKALQQISIEDRFAVAFAPPLALPP